MVAPAPLFAFPNTPAVYTSAAASRLRVVVRNAIANHGLPPAAGAITNAGRVDLIRHINDLCTKYNLRVHPETGELVSLEDQP